MSDRGVVRGTRRRRSISDSGHSRLNSTILDSDLVSDSHDLVNKFETLRIKISAWESIIKYELHGIDSIKKYDVSFVNSQHVNKVLNVFCTVHDFDSFVEI